MCMISGDGGGLIAMCAEKGLTLFVRNVFRQKASVVICLKRDDSSQKIGWRFKSIIKILQLKLIYKSRK